jgi:alcohol dehydrogenase
MQTYTYVSKGKFELMEKPKPVLMHERDAVVKVTLASICSSDLHIKHGSVPRAVPGITVGHEMVGIVECNSCKTGGSCDCKCRNLLW